MSLRIGVIGFGSLVNHLHSQENNCSLKVQRPAGRFPRPAGVNADSPFVEAEQLKLPLRLGRISRAGTDKETLTLALCPAATKEQVYVAESAFHNLNKAIKNLRERQGISNAERIGYVNLAAGTSRSHTAAVGDRIKKWAALNHFDAVIWTDLPTKGVQFGAHSTGREVLPLLQNNALLLKNTKKYISSLPCKTALQAEILGLSGHLSPQAYQNSLTADFALRDQMPESHTPRSDWFKPAFGVWGPLARLFPAPEIPQGVNAVRWKRDRLAESAKKYLGLKYKNADGKRGHFPARGCGLDCSNFAAWVYNYALGIKITSDVDKLWSGPTGRKLQANEPLKKGDLILLDGDPKHVVIYLDKHHVIDSTSGRAAGVQISDIRKPANKWYTPNSSNRRFLGVKRLIE